MSADKQTGPVIQTPHVAPAWRDRFVLEQRLADRTGAQIGDALATVDAHCAESGESAQEAFGDPTAYSASLVGEAAGPPARIPARTVAGIAAGLLGLLTAPRAVEAWVTDEAVAVSGGDLGGALVVALLMAAVLRWPSPVIGGLVRHPARAVLGVFGVLIALLIPQALWREALLETGWGIPLAVGLVLLAASVLLLWSGLGDQDPVRDPRGGVASSRAGAWFTVALFPVLAVLMVGMDALFRALL